MIPVTQISGSLQAIPPINGDFSPKEVSPAQANMFQQLLSDPNFFTIPGDFTGVCNTLQDITRVTGQLTRIVNAASTSVVLINAIRNNANGFALMVKLGAVTAAAQAAGVDPRDIVTSAVNKANDLLSTPMKFLEQAFRARAYAQASFTGSGIADLFRALGSISELLQACKTFTDLISGGISANFGPNADSTEAGKRLTARGISIGGSQIRAGLKAVAQAMRDMGTLWDPNDPQWIGTPNGLIISLRDQGIIEDIGLREACLKESIVLDDDDDVYYTSPYTASQALKHITGTELQIIIERTNCNLTNPDNVLTAADLCIASNVFSQEALDNIPYGNIQEIGFRIANMNLRKRITWDMLADTLDQLDLPDIGLIDNPSFASDMANLTPYLGHGSGLFGDAQLKDLIGTAGGAAHTEAYQLIIDASERLNQTAEGRALKVALDYYDLHSNPSDPYYSVAESNLIIALEALKTSKDPEVQLACADSEKGILDSAIQLVSEVTNAVATGYAVYQTLKGIYALALTLGNAIAETAASQGADGGAKAGAASNAAVAQSTAVPEAVWVYTAGIRAVLAMVTSVAEAFLDATGLGDLIDALINPNTKGGQVMLAMRAEIKNKSLLATIGANIPSIDIEDEAARRRAQAGQGLTLEQQNLITAYATNHNLNSEALKELLFVNAYYGYQRHFFENQAGYFEGYRVKRNRKANIPKNALTSATATNGPGTGPTASATNPPASMAEALASAASRTTG